MEYADWKECEILGLLPGQEFEQESDEKVCECCSSAEGKVEVLWARGETHWTRASSLVADYPADRRSDVCQECAEYLTGHYFFCTRCGEEMAHIEDHLHCL